MGVAVGVLGALSVVTVSTDANAAYVGNPGYFEFIVVGGMDSHFRFTSGTGKIIQLDDGTSSHYFFADLDGDGIVSGVGSSFDVGSFNVGGTPVAAELVLQSTSEGRVSVPDEFLDFDEMRARTRFTWNSGQHVCNTSTFVMNLSSFNWSSGAQGVCTTGYRESTGQFCVVASGFVVPALGGQACGGNGDILNGYFNLGVSSGSYMQILGGQVDPIITQ